MTQCYYRRKLDSSISSKLYFRRIIFYSPSVTAGGRPNRDCSRSSDLSDSSVHSATLTASQQSMTGVVHLRHHDHHQPEFASCGEDLMWSMLDHCPFGIQVISKRRTKFTEHKLG